jgi:type I restriction enzyme M protein
VAPAGDNSERLGLVVEGVSDEQDACNKGAFKGGGVFIDSVAVTDNVLFEGGAGETLRRRLLKEFDVHTLVRLPTGVFYAGGVKANILFFEKRPAGDSPWTSTLWVYDIRTNKHYTQKKNTMRRHDFDDFVACYSRGRPRSERAETEHSKSFTYDEILARDKANLDIIWLKDNSLEDAAHLPAPDALAREIIEELEAALSEFVAIAESLEALTSDSE